MKAQKPIRSQAGFTLIEILVAILICSIGLLGILGLQARAMQYSVGAEDVVRAARLVDEAVWALQNGGTGQLPESARLAWEARVRDPAVGFAGGQGEVVGPDVSGVVRITIRWTPPDSSGSQPRQYVTEVGP